MVVLWLFCSGLACFNICSVVFNVFIRVLKSFNISFVFFSCFCCIIAREMWGGRCCHNDLGHKQFKLFHWTTRPMIQKRGIADLATSLVTRLRVYKGRSYWRYFGPFITEEGGGGGYCVTPPEIHENALSIVWELLQTCPKKGLQCVWKCCSNANGSLYWQ